MDFQFTNFASGRMGPAVLSLAIAAYLLTRRRADGATYWLGVYCALLSIFNIAYIIGFSLNDPAGGYAWHLACVIAPAAAARVQLAYHFPEPMFPRERRIALYITFGAAVAGILEYFLRVDYDFILGMRLHAYGSRYRSLLLPLFTFFFYIWSLFVSFRVARVILKSAGGRGGSLRRFLDEWKANPALRVPVYLILLTCGELALNGLHLVAYVERLDVVTREHASNLLVLGLLSGYVMVYSAATVGRTGFMHRLVGISLVALLVLLSLTAWAVELKDLENLRRSGSRLGRMALNQGASMGKLKFVQGGTPRRLLTNNTGVSDSALDQALEKSYFDGRFYFASAGKKHYYAVRVDGPEGAALIGFDYAEYRRYLHGSSGLMVVLMLTAALTALLVFPFLFRASLLRPLRLLLGDLGRAHPEQGDSGEPSGPDEVVQLRASFQKMTELLRNARRELSDYSPHLEQVEKIVELETQYVTVGTRTLVYRSAAVEKVIRVVERIREFKQPVLITGETGTGKELFARMIHGGRGEDAGPTPFVAVNCAALPENLWESEIFGHRKGAFTDAVGQREGRIVQAGTGTVFFDEIGEMPLQVQAKMLRLLQENQFTPVGADQPLKANCRFVFATNRDLDDMAARGKFREDLLYRIRVFPVELPALRERPEDIPYLARFLLERAAREYSLPVPSIEPSALQVLMRYSWPGNVREMENVLARALALVEGDSLEREHFPDIGGGPGGKGRGGLPGTEAVLSGEISFDQEVRRFSRTLIEKAMETAGGNKTRAAGILGLNRSTLRYRMNELGMLEQKK